MTLQPEPVVINLADDLKLSTSEEVEDDDVSLDRHVRH